MMVERSALPSDGDVALLHNEAVEKEYQRWLSNIGPADPYLGKFTIGLHEALQAHFLLIDFFFDVGEGIGGTGPKSINLLHSALSRQFAEFGGKSKWNDRIQICASLMYGLIKNHPFHDANKRTAFLTAILHLQKIGRTPIISHQEFEDFTVNISDGSLANYPNYEVCNGVGHDADVAFIASFLKKATRQIDLRTKQITYNELNRIISKRGLRIESPNGNRIDLVRILDVDGSAPARLQPATQTLARRDRRENRSHGSIKSRSSSFTAASSNCPGSIFALFGECSR